MSLAFAASLVAAVPAASQVTVDFATGDAWSLRTPVTISQDGFPDIRIDEANFSTRPFTGFPYYDIQVGLWSGSRGWIIGFLHHKLHMEDPPAPEVEKFQITNGYTIFSLSRGWKLGHLILAAGAGVVLANPDVKIRGLDEADDKGFLQPLLGAGYYWSGGTILLSAQRNFRVKGGWHVSLGGKVSGSYARVPIPNGHATVPNVAFHLHAGFGLTL